MPMIRISDELHERIKAFIDGRMGSIGEWAAKWLAEGLDREAKSTKK